MAKKNSSRRGKVLLVAFADDGNAVVRIEMSYDEYYGESPPIIDSNQFRAARGIRRVTGKIYDSRGCLQQLFDNLYNERGEYLRSRVVHDDGAVIEDSFR